MTRKPQRTRKPVAAASPQKPRAPWSHYYAYPVGHSGLFPADEEVLSTLDSHGDTISGCLWKNNEALPAVLEDFGAVSVTVAPEVTAEEAVRLLLKLAWAIQRHGLQTEQIEPYTCYTEHPLVRQYDALRRSRARLMERARPRSGVAA